jgi:hypothetical protein
VIAAVPLAALLIIPRLGAVHFRPACTAVTVQRRSSCGPLEAHAADACDAAGPEHEQQPMKLSTACRAAVLAVLGCASAMLAAPAHGYTAGEPPPWAICGSASIASLGVLEHSLSPSSGATLEAGAPVTFSGQSESPVTFAVASSPALLASPT